MTKDERKWVEFCKFEHGCVICRRNGIADPTPSEFHHMLSGGRRMGHLKGFGLCFRHHHGAPGVVGRDQCLRRFEAAYGLENAMLAEVQNEYVKRFDYVASE